jgi:hypothetical protein
MMQSELLEFLSFLFRDLIESTTRRGLFRIPAFVCGKTRLSFLFSSFPKLRWLLDAWLFFNPFGFLLEKN